MQKNQVLVLHQNTGEKNGSKYGFVFSLAQVL